MTNWKINNVNMNKWIEFQTTNNYKISENTIDNYYLKKWYYYKNLAKGPLNVVIDITRFCNLRCKHCSEKESLNRGEMSIDTFELILNNLLYANVYRIIITGGEPLIHRDIMKIIKKIKDYGFALTILTNLNISTKKLESIIKLMNLMEDKIQISIDDVFEEYEFMRMGADFKLLEKNMKFLKEKGIYTKVNMVITKWNYTNMPKVLKFCSENNVKSLRFTPYFGRDREEIAPLFEELVPAYDETLSTYEKLGTKVSIDVDPIPLVYPIFEKLKENSDFKFQTDYMMCPACVSSIDIDINGDVFPCSYLHVTKFKCGNVLEQPIVEIWNSQIAKNFRKFVSDDEKCNSCSQHEKCRGGCKASIFTCEMGTHDSNCDKECI